MFEISKEFHFSASHQLGGLPDTHPCSRLHGHNYIVKVILTSDTLDGTGFVVDYGDLKPFATWIDDTLDHRHLNDVLVFQPSAENMARAMAELIQTHFVPGHVNVAVAVSETPKTWATYRA